MDLEDPLKPHETTGEEPFRLEPIGTLGQLQSEGQSLPVYGTLNGVAVAVVPLDHYKRLMLSALHGTMAKLDAAAAPQSKVPPFGLSTIERDPEVAEFIQSRFRGGVTIDQSETPAATSSEQTAPRRALASSASDCSSKRSSDAVRTLLAVL